VIRVSIALLGLLLSGVITPLQADETNFAKAMPDFSRAGYHGGKKWLPKPKVTVNIRDLGAVGDGKQDVSGIIQAAIDKVSKSGGVVFIPQGQWLIKKPVSIRQNNVILRGAGSQKTILVCPLSLTDIAGASKSWSWSGGLIKINPFRSPRKSLGQVTKRVYSGERRLTVKALSPGNSPKVDEWLELQWFNDKGKDTLLNHLYGGVIKKKRMGTELQNSSAVRVREWVQIKEVKGDQWVLQAPLSLELRPEWRPTLVRRSHIEECGIEGLAFQFPKTKYPGHLKEKGYNALSVSLAIHCWVKDIRIRNADSGLFLHSCAHVTAEDLDISGRRMHHPMSVSWSTYCLIQRWRLTAPHRHGTTLSWAAHGNVFADGFARNLAMDCHRAAPFQNLHTNIIVEQGSNSVITPFRSGGSRPRGPHSARRNVYWNIEFRFNDKASKRVKVSSHKEWPLGVFYSWHGNRALDFKPIEGLKQQLKLINKKTEIANLYEYQRQESRKAY
jgi:hypothetical protein